MLYSNFTFILVNLLLILLFLSREGLTFASFAKIVFCIGIITFVSMFNKKKERDN